MSNEDTTTQPFPGMERISEMMLRIVESEEPKRNGNHRGETPNPGSMAQQRSVMIEETRRALAELLQRGTAGVFMLSSAQLRTLESMEIPENLRNEVISLNLLRTRGGQYRINERLNTVMTLPPRPPAGETDWKLWWLDHQGSLIGIARPQDHDPLADPVSETLNGVIRAMAEEASRKMPTPGDIARDILRRGVWNRNSNKWENQPRDGRVDLTQVWSSMDRMRVLALRMGTDGDARERLRPLSAEALLAELRLEEIEVRQDMGSITGLQELRFVLRENGVADIRANARTGRWQDAESRHRHVIGGQTYVTGARNRIPPKSLWPEGLQISERELALIALTAPEHPAREEAPGFQKDPAASAIGFVNRMAPSRVRDYLEGRTDEVPARCTQQCPRAGECTSWCGHLQASGQFPMPLTHEGRHQTCGYWHFLEQHGHLDPARREAHARMELEKTREGIWGKRARSRTSETPPDEKNRSESPEAQRNTETPEEKGTVQPALF